LFSRWLSLATFDAEEMAGHFKDVNLYDVAEESIQVLRPLADEKGVDLVLDAPEDLALIKGGKGSLGEIINNLISNSIKYNRPGGWVKVILSEQGEEVFVEVKDNGLGINDEHLARIFEEFYRVDGRRNAPIKGSGLGLSIVKKLVDAHGAIISVESTFGEGTTFKISFPKIFRPEVRL